MTDAKVVTSVKEEPKADGTGEEDSDATVDEITE